MKKIKEFLKFLVELFIISGELRADCIKGCFGAKRKNDGLEKAK